MACHRCRADATTPGWVWTASTSPGALKDRRLDLCAQCLAALHAWLDTRPPVPKERLCEDCHFADHFDPQSQSSYYCTLKHYRVQNLGCCQWLKRQKEA